MGTGGLASEIKSLHKRKDADYGPSWKKRGELTGIIANIARKVDRIERVIARGTQCSDEGALDTAVDLFVYLLKYRLYLVEQDTHATIELGFSDIGVPLSDSQAAFDRSVDQMVRSPVESGSVSALVEKVRSDFERLHEAVLANQTPIQERLRTVTELARLAHAIIYSLKHQALGLETTSY